MINTFLNPEALVFVLITVAVSYLIYYKSSYSYKQKLTDIMNLSHLMVLAISLIGLVLALSSFEGYAALEKTLSFIILSNLYCVIFNITTRICNCKT